MGYVLPEIILPLILTFLVGLGLGWLLWRWRSEKVTYSDWETSESTTTTRATAPSVAGAAAGVGAARVAAKSGATAPAGVATLVGDTDTDDAELLVGAEQHPYGEGSHAPLADRSAPDGYTIKGNVDSMLYHRPDSRNYRATIAEVWFDTADRAETAGFRLSPTHPKDSATTASKSDAAPIAFVGAEQHPYGEGSHAPLADRSAPDGYTIKGNVDSMLYHRPDSRNYRATIAEVWFDTADRAEAAGFTKSPTHPKGT